MRKKILVAGASVYALENISDDSMLYSWLMELSKRIDFKATLICRHTKNYLNSYPINKMIPNLDFQSKKKSLNKRFFGFNQGDKNNHLNNIIQNITKSDLLIIGGDPFIEITLDNYRGILSYIEILTLLARFTKTPVLLHGIHFGRPPQSKFAKDKMNFILDNVTMVSTRSKQALKILSKIRPNKKRLDILHTDDAYGLKCQTSKFLFKNRYPKFLSWINHERKKNKKIILLTIRTLYWTWTDKKRNSFIGEVAKFLNQLQKAEKISYIFFPHCTYNKDNYWEDDRSGHNEIVKLLKKKDFFVFSERIEVSNIKNIFDSVDFVIGNRRHSGIFSAISEKPFMLFGEEKHVSGVYEDMGLNKKKLFLNYDQINHIKLEKIYKKINRDKKILQKIKIGIINNRNTFKNGIHKISSYVKGIKK